VGGGRLVGRREEEARRTNKRRMRMRMAANAMKAQETAMPLT
jgi:hypothetical protein